MTLSIKQADIIKQNFRDENNYTNEVIDKIMNKIIIIKTTEQQSEYNSLINSISTKEGQLDSYKYLLSINLGNNMEKRIYELEEQLIILKKRKEELDKLSDR